MASLRLLSSVSSIGHFCTVTLSVFSVFSLYGVTAAPNVEGKTPRQVSFRPNPDGGFTGSYSFADAIDVPGFQTSIADTASLSVGPSGVSFSNSDSSSGNFGFGGLKSGFNNANANSFSAGPGGFSNANANAFNAGGPGGRFSGANANTFGGGPGGRRHGSAHANAFNGGGPGGRFSGANANAASLDNPFFGHSLFK